MKELEVLLNQRWVLKSENKELYYQLRDAIGDIRKYASDKLGCQVTENALMVKMEKIPVIPETFMGIQNFSSKEEYAFFCILLMFLEEKDTQEQFILSQLTEYISANMPGEPVDWTVYTSRRRLIKVLRYAVTQGKLSALPMERMMLLWKMRQGKCCTKTPEHRVILCAIFPRILRIMEDRKIFWRVTGLRWTRTGELQEDIVCISACYLLTCDKEVIEV